MYEWQKYQLEITRVNTSNEEQLSITGPSDIVKLFGEHAKERDQESFWVLVLDQKNQCLGIQELYRGSASGAAVKTGEAFRFAVLLQASAMVIVHNHPSGDLQASDEDIALTKAIHTAAVHLDIDFLDHVIVAGDEVLSIRKHLSDQPESIWYNESHIEGAMELIEMAGLRRVAGVS